MWKEAERVPKQAGEEIGRLREEEIRDKEKLRMFVTSVA
jgi:hypothetical protein